MLIDDWFDPYDIEHIKAYKVLYDTGAWPEGFIPEWVDFSTPSWRVFIMNKMCNAWVKKVLKDWEEKYKSGEKSLAELYTDLGAPDMVEIEDDN